MKRCRLYSQLPILDRQKNTARINLGNLAYNYKQLCGISPSARHICVVKSDAYGHGADECVRKLCREGCDFFAVSCLEEAIEVKETLKEIDSSADVLILGYTFPDYANLLNDYDIIQTCLSLEYAKQLDAGARKAGCEVRVHIALDTGMNRIGLCAHSDREISLAVEEATKICAMSNLRAEGMFTHFACADDKEPDVFLPDSLTRKQYERFMSVKRLLEEKNIKLFCHVSNSAASVRFPDYAMDGVRFGIMLYGYPPSGYMTFPLKPVMRLETIISHIHPLLCGEKVSYGATYSASTERSIATLPIGYADGFIRKYSGANVGVYTDMGRFDARLVGRICMDQCMIDITGIPAKAGDRVCLFGDNETGLEKLSEKAGTIEYESLCIITSRVIRTYEDSD